ncbi:MBL fold metallo-hydrolase [Nocardioides guangzhouensis]|uniref:MBL fold metallo-hydrolase n=1 Tax=Nocardioides guangzhouensis TaxID=2497878 RepID=A0A4Q4Z9F8_9ACTN|nr:MBL fold metallo-hydrolase [Nocardioides guangzhouensis]RYP84105.1 MBL fold metallo-hydrolase [Nocardioides guangzhouensis]
MRLTVVGCSGSYPGPDSPASCYLVEATGVDESGEGRTWRILLDLGNGALGALHRYADPLAVDAVFLSHLHADHCLDLCGYYVMRKYHPAGHQPRIPVYGPEGTAARMARAYDLPEDPGMTEEFDFHAYPDGGAVELGPFRIEPVAVEHPVPAYALRVHAGGRLLVYTGDSGVCEPVEHAAEGADLFLAEAAFCDGEENPEGIHLTGTDVGNMAKRAGVGRLVLTHIPAWHDRQVAFDEARAVWDGPLEVAAAGATYDV